MPRSERILDLRPYTAELLAKLVVDRYRFHLPVYRKTKQLEDCGIFLSRSLLNDLILSSWENCEPIWARLSELNRQQDYHKVDESPICRVFDKKKSKRVYVWDHL